MHGLHTFCESRRKFPGTCGKSLRLGHEHLRDGPQRCWRSSPRSLAGGGAVGGFAYL